MKTIHNIYISLFFVILSLQITAQNNEKSNNNKLYSQIIHSFGFEYNNTFYTSGKTLFHPSPNLGYNPIISYGNEWLLKYNITFKSGVGISVELVKGYCNYRFENRRNNEKILSSEIGIKDYFLDLVENSNMLGANMKLSYRYNINSWLAILPEIGLQMLHYKPLTIIILDYDEIQLEDGSIQQKQMQSMKYTNEVFDNHFSPDLSIAVNFLFHKKNDPRHNFTIGINTNLCFRTRYFGGYSIQAPFENISDCLFFLSSNYIGLRLGYSFSYTPKFRKG